MNEQAKEKYRRFGVIYTTDDGGQVFTGEYYRPEKNPGAAPNESPFSNFYSAIKSYAAGIFSRFKHPKDISSKL